MQAIKLNQMKWNLSQFYQNQYFFPLEKVTLHLPVFDEQHTSSIT
jgi:hypothetical protein